MTILKSNKKEIIETSVGRIIFNESLPNEMSFRNSEQGKDALKEITAECFSLLGNDATLKALDAIKALGFRYASQSGTTIAINDIGVPIEKDKIIQEAEEKISTLEEQYQDGLIREIEKYTNFKGSHCMVQEKSTQNSICHPSTT